MDPQALIVAAAAGAVSLALAASLWALAIRRSVGPGHKDLLARLAAAETLGDLFSSAEESFGTVLIAVDAGRARLISGEGALAERLLGLGLPSGGEMDLVSALAKLEPAPGGRIARLIEAGEPFAFEIASEGARFSIEGRAAGAIAFLRVAPAASRLASPALGDLAGLLDTRAEPAWIARSDGSLVWANRAWLAAVGASSIKDAQERRLTLDRAINTMIGEAAGQRKRRSTVRWASLPRGRRAFRISATPLEDGSVGVLASDVTDSESAAATLRQRAAAHEALLGQLADAVAIFSSEKRLVYHNPAFAELWDLEPAWLAEDPGHGELLDRLRRSRRLPEAVDFASFKAAELDRYGRVEPSPEMIWRLPSDRTLRVASQPHPDGGIALTFSDITHELRLKTQFNHLIQVQKATLDKLTDAVAVFGADGRLKLHNEAFERFWSMSPAQASGLADFDGLIDLCVRQLPDRAFWRDLKARITDADPEARAAVGEEMSTADGRVVAFQSRPLPDGATLVSFADVTGAKRLEGALRDREAAVVEAERLKREFVGNVSYELRTPLTTIIGYSELLERDSEDLSERGREYLAAVRSAASQLTRSIDNVLDIAQIDAGEMALEVSDVDVAELLAAAAVRWADEAEARGIGVRLNVDGASGLIRGDARRLAQVLDHLAHNALRHTPARGSLTFSADRAAGELRLQVADTGRGIPFHVQAHIFDRFGGSALGGPGLGLALVKAIVELHGGWVDLESAPDAGASFTCHLPEEAQASAARPELFRA
ncbi:MAG: ATP-binding protein [Caulobacteraceae bacterium]